MLSRRGSALTIVCSAGVHNFMEYACVRMYLCMLLCCTMYCLYTCTLSYYIHVVLPSGVLVQDCPLVPSPPRSITDQELQPLRMQLSELEARIVEQVGGTT